jgi:hypothetical protein
MSIKEQPAEKTEAIDDNNSETGLTPSVEPTPPGAVVLVGTEAEAQLPALKESDALTITLQLIDTQRVPPDSNAATQLKIKLGPLAQYAAIAPEDGLESGLGRVAVALTNTTMDSFGRAAQNTEWPKVRELDLQLGIKGAQALAAVVEAIDKHRGRDRPKVAVGQLNVQAGGQAIVANVECQEQARRESNFAPSIDESDRDGKG